ncbi:hypothetical protein LINPERPRIM_LOCUS13486 [Linum perenne]
MCCTIALAWRTPPIPVLNFQFMYENCMSTIMVVAGSSEFAEFLTIMVKTRKPCTLQAELRLL